MCDILRGNGSLEGPASDSSANDVEVIFCNPDLLWKNEWEGPRLGQGGFRKAWEGVWSVGRVLRYLRQGLTSLESMSRWTRRIL